MKIQDIRVSQGEMLPPWYYGLAYHEFYSAESVFYPIPFNFFARWLRHLSYLWNRLRGTPGVLDRLFHKAIKRAYRDGLRAGRAP